MYIQDGLSDLRVSQDCITYIYVYMQANVNQRYRLIPTISMDHKYVLRLSHGITWS